jgi:nitroreductase
MDVYEAVQKRCSVRAYQNRPVEQEKLDRVLDAGRLSPSARNTQARKFVVVRDAEIRQALADAAEQPFIAHAPVVIAVVSLEPDRLMHCGVPCGPVDCAIAIDHMTLAATAEGLGTCWIGHFDQDACCRLLDVPPGAKIIELLLLGYQDEKPGPKSRKKPEQIICYERFS